MLRMSKEANPPSKAGHLRVREFLGRYATVLALVTLTVVFGLLRPETFLTVGNFQALLTTQAVLIILALGVTMSLACGEFDLSVASVLGFSAGLLAYLSASEQWSVGAATIVTLLAALIIGTLNGVIVVYIGVNSLITTLGTGTLVSGLALAIFGAETIGGVPEPITTPFRAELFGIQTPVLLAFALALALWYFLGRTPGGRYVYFTGEGREAARLAGISVNLIRLIGLISSAFFAWLAGYVLVGQTGAAQASFGDPFLLPAFAAAFLGATTINPGRYNVWGTVVAVYLLAVGTTGLQLLGAQDWVEYVFNGGVLVLAVVLARLASKEDG